MTDKLIIQSIGDDPQDQFIKYMDLEGPIHRDYAAQCGADYEYYVGWQDRRCNPTWNRIIMMLRAFERGYRKIVWLDADTLVVRPECDVFAGTSNDAPLLMTRVIGAHVEIPWASFGPTGEIVPAPGWDCYNDGVLIVNDTPEARAALTFAWQHRRAEHLPWHIPGMPELDWLLDWVFEHPDHVEQLDDRWNWMGYDHTCPKNEAVIRAWHGIPYEERWEQFRAGYDERYALVT